MIYASRIPARTIAAAASAFGVKAVAITSGIRTRDVTRARFAVYAALRAAGLSLHEAAAACGRSDHTTVLHGVASCAELRSDATYEARYQIVEAAALRDAPVPDAPRGLAASVAYCEQWQSERTRIRTLLRGKESQRVEEKLKALTVAMRELVQVLKEIEA